MTKFLKYWAVIFLLVLSGCAVEPPPPWGQMTVEQRVESLQGQLEAARSSGERNMKGDLKRSVLDMVKKAKKNPAPEFDAVMSEAGELVVEYNFHDAASEVYEYLGDKTKAVQYAEKDGDLERAQKLLAGMKDSGSDGSSAGEANASLGLALLEKAEQKYAVESKSSHTRMGNAMTKTREILADAAKQLAGVPMEEKDLRRLLDLQFKTAVGKDEPLAIAAGADWIQPESLSREDYLLRRIVLWKDLAAVHRANSKVADVFHAKMTQALGDKDLEKISEGKRKELLVLRAETAYGSGEFQEALGYAKELFPGEDRVLHLYEFAATSKKDSIRDNPFVFPAPEKGELEQTYIYLFSPTQDYVEKGFEEKVEAGNEMEWKPADDGGDGIKVSFRSDSGFLYLFTLTSGFRRTLEPGSYDNAVQIGVTNADPGIGFAGKGNFKYGQFRIYELEREKGDDKKLSRLAVDFLGSGTGELSDVCYGRIRFRSRIK